MSRVTKKIIIAPLNWGLGHATRCIPLIHYLVEGGHEVLIASDGAALDLLRQEFPSLHYKELPAYDIQYESKHMVWNMSRQLSKIRDAIRAENKMLRNLLIDYRADLIISDNRYGCYNSVCPSIIICHQINIPVSRLLSPFVDRIHHRYLSRFDQVWIPDLNGEEKLTGRMTQYLGALPTKFIGPQSRFEPLPDIRIKDQIICVLSGPEPQRSLLENELVKQLSVIDKPSILVQGKIDGIENKVVDQINNLTIINYLTGDQLNRQLQESKYIVARSGYSTIMDLVKINRSGLLIPTPGQPEQEYLAKYLAQKQWMFSQKQDELNIIDFLDKNIPLQFPKIKFEGIKDVIQEWL